MEEGKYEEALHIYFDLLQKEDNFQSENLLATTRLNIGNIYYRLDQYPNAKKQFAIAESLATKTNDLDLKCEVMRRTIDNYYFLKQPDEAREYLNHWVTAEEERNKEGVSTRSSKDLVRGKADNAAQ